MTLCMLCAQPTLGDEEVCVFHLHGQGDDWATGNRTMCDFLHRGIVPVRRRERPVPVERLETLEEALSA